MSDEFEFNDMHKDSFVRAKKPGDDKPKSKPLKAPDTKSNKEQVDDYVPEKVGQVVDNVFGKLDNLVNDAADYLFGNKGKATFPKEAPPKAAASPLGLPLKPEAPPVIPEIKYKPETQATPPPVAQPKTLPKPKAEKPQIKQLSTLQSGMRQPQMITPVMPEAKPKISGPVISRTTSLSELDIPLEYLDDPDLSRYFDQMKLYESQAVEGGLCNMSQFEAESILKRGYWKNKFNIQFEDLKRIDPGIHPLEMAKSRFIGMRPVYKAWGQRFASKEALIAAIEEDISAYLHNKSSKNFHRFIYQVVSTRY